MPSELEIFHDRNGNLRKCGSLIRPSEFVSAYPAFESVVETLEDAAIRRLILDPNRAKRRKMFGPKWVQNQRSKGSCNGFAIAGGLSKGRRLRGITDDLILSGAWAYSLMNRGVDNGSMLEDGMQVVETHGICPESLVPWDMIFTSQMPSNAKAEALKHKGLECYPVETKQGFRTALAIGYPVIVAVHAGGNFQRLNKNGIAGVDNGVGNHSIHCDDICLVNGVEVYDSCNSWGVQYGQDGRAYLTWSSFEQTFRNHMFYAVASTEEFE